MLVRVPGRNRWRFAVAALLLGGGLAVPAGAEPAGACPRVTTTADGWRRVTPSFGGKSGQLAAYAVAPHDPRTILASDGDSIARSRDGGCTWTTVYALPDTPSAEQPHTKDRARVADLVVARQRSYAVVVGMAGPPAVLVSADAGTSWKPASIPLLTTSAHRTPRLVTDLSGRYAYLLGRAAQTLLFDGFGGGDALFVTEDAGATWSLRPVDVTSPVAALTSVRDVGVDPQSAQDVWVTTNGGLLHSGDAGRTWEMVEQPLTGDLGPLSVTHRAGQGLQVAAASVYESLVYLRAPGGGLTAINTPGSVGSLAGGRVPTELAIATADGVYELDAGRLTWSPARTADPPLSDVSTDYSAAPSFHACACADGTIWSRAPRHFEARGPEVPRVDDKDYPGYYGCAPGKRAADPARFAPSAVLPAVDELSLKPGESRTVTYRFRIQPRELDLYFLLDAGSRSGLYGCEARQGAVWAAERLARERNLRVGVGEYRDYVRPRGSLEELFASPACLAALDTDFVYKRKLRMGGVDEAFRASMSKLTVGHCRPGNAALPALLQAVTGRGQDLAPSGPSPYDIRTAQDAGFAKDAFKVVVNVNSSFFATPQRVRGYAGPDFMEVIDELVARDVKQVGIYVPQRSKKHHDEEPLQAETGAEDLARVAQDTGAVARRPVECAASVAARLKVGDPLVCHHVDNTGKKKLTVPPMGRQMVDLVSAMSDPKPMGVSLLPGADSGVTAVTPAVTKTLDHLLPHTLTYAVRFTCGAGDGGQVKRAEVGGQVAGTVVASATTVVRCGAPPAAPRLPDFVPQLGLVAPIAAPAAPNLPPNNLAPNTAPQPNSQPQNVAQHLLQGVGVPQEEVQPRLAYAGADPVPDNEDQLAMSGLARNGPYDVPAWLVFEAGLLMAGAAGAYGYRRRTRTAPARVRAQRF